jgi:hypothetical protein
MLRKISGVLLLILGATMFAPIFTTGAEGEPISAVRLINEDESGYVETGLKVTGERSLHVLTELLGVSSDAIKDFFFEVAKGSVTGHESIVRNAHNDDVKSVEEDIWHVGGTYIFPASADTVEIVSDDVNDTLLGSGARTFFIEGLDINYDYISETVNLNGTTPVTTVNSYLRVWGGRVVTAGGTTSNAGELLGTHTTSGDSLIGIGPNVGITKLSMFTVPAGQTAYIVSIVASTNKAQGIQFRIKTRELGETFNNIFLFESSGQPVVAERRSPTSIPEKTDLVISALTQTGSSSVSITIELVLVDN